MITSFHVCERPSREEFAKHRNSFDVVSFSLFFKLREKKNELGSVVWREKSFCQDDKSLSRFHRESGESTRRPIF